ncbi:MAG: FliH/SctL family protein [Pseudomonadota bacterium]|nr:FliH/SctL family protein [Pseudomonadota bacterium]
MSRKSSLNKTALNKSAFQALTYSRVELPPKPATNPQSSQSISDFHLPRLTKSSKTRGTKTRRKISSQESFKTAIFPQSTTPSSESTTITEPHLPTTQELDEHRIQAENEKLELLMHARGEAVAIIAKAEKEAKKRTEEIAEKAREEGLKSAEAEIEKRLSRFDELLERLTSTQELCRQQHEKEMVKLALACARRLINREISLDESVIADCVRELFSESNIQGSITLLLNSDDLKLINELRTQLLTDFPLIHDLKIEAGEGIERGGCILESSMGRIDASLHSKFEELNRLLINGQ